MKICWDRKLKYDKEFFKQINERKPVENTGKILKHISTLVKTTSVSEQVKDDALKTIDDLLNPKQMNQQVEPKWLVKKKEKRKKRGLHW